MQSIAIARLTARVMQISTQWGFSPPPEDFGQMLPFPPEREMFTDGKNLRVDRETARCFFRLIAAKKLPKWAAGDMVRYAIEWKRIAQL